MKRGEAGFTLLEMLVALVVFALVMDGIAQSFRFGLMAWRQGPARMAEPEDLAGLDAALTRMIGQALPGSMTGRPAQLSFTTRLPPGAGLPTPLADAAITLQDGALILRYRPHPAGIPLAPPPAARVEMLARGVAAMRVTYLAQPAPAAQVWTDTWEGGRLPVLIRLHIELADGRDWPDLLVAPAGGSN